MRYLGLLFASLAFGACTSVGQLGVVTKSSSDLAASIRSGRNFTDLGPAEAKGCRSLALGVIPWGNADIQFVLDKALKSSGGDALINVTTANSLYGFIPLYNVFSFTCTTVKGTAIKFQ